MVTDERAAIEAEVRRRCEAGDVQGAATAAIEGLGPEVMGFLVVIVGDPNEAADVFADVCVRMWKGLPTFRWDSSLRTWTYVLARRAAHAHRQSRADWRDRHVRISDVPEIDELIVRMRTTTMARVKEQRQTRAERLRAQLTPDEQTLLVLRVDRELEWRDVARVLADDEITDDEIDRAAANLRKRFERLRDKLRELAAADTDP
jgi:RNA polymerase sigma-70 factor, ECF subfamily